jgi:hypothetical protein
LAWLGGFLFPADFLLVLINTLRRKNMITVVMPTMWRAPELQSSIAIMEASPYVKQIQLINNDQSCAVSLSSTKICMTTPEQNIYITESWNLGVSLSTTEIVCLLNDDIVLPLAAWEFVVRHWPSDAGIVGLGFSNMTGTDYVLHSASGRGYGFGAAMFKYIHGQHYYLVGPFQGRMSATTDSAEFNEIKRQDAINWKKYE